AIARLLLFGARDVWFVVALPLYLVSVLGWEYSSVGGFLALWIIGYGFIQSMAPRITGVAHGTPDGRDVIGWALGLATITLLLAIGVYQSLDPLHSLIPGLLIFGAVFAVNSSVHSYLIVSYSHAERVSMDVGFYYMANAMGRLIGTVLSGYLFQVYGLLACLIVSGLFLLISAAVATKLPVAAN
ncbi:MAG: MFS transporter, partial [Arenicella sp.]|nr:MFS transporter [Arenicella sp.]